MATDYSIPELRDTLGYTNYVVSTRKNLNKTVSSVELKRYYSNIDAEIYIDGEWFEDCQNIEWDIQSNKMPLYGFNSFIFDDVACANRIIRGSFVINFTKPRTIESYINQGNSTSIGSQTMTYEDEQTQIANIKTEQINTKINGSELIPNHKHKALWSLPFEIDIVCGENESSSDGITNNAVHIILTKCYIIDSSSIRNKDGGVASEIYHFIAQDFKTIS